MRNEKCRNNFDMKKLIFLGCIIFMTGVGLSAQDLSLEDARTLGLLNSNALSSANSAIRSADLSEQSRIYNTYLPSLSLGGVASMNLWNASNAINPPDTPLDSLTANASATVSESITFQGNRNSILKSINAIASQSAKIDAQIAYYSVLDSVDTAYYTVLQAQATLEAQEQSLATAQTNLSMADVKQAGGMLNSADYLKAESDMESAQNACNQARRNLTLSAAKLKFLLGLNQSPEVQQIDLSGYEDLVQHLAAISDDEADNVYRAFLKLLYTSNPTYAKYGLADQSADKNLSLAKLGYAPSLTGSFKTGVDYTYKDGFSYNPGTLSLSLDIPLDFWVTANNVAKSQISRDSAATDYKNADVQLQTDLQTSIINTIGYAGSILSYRRSQEYAEKHYEYIQELFKLSQSSISDLGDAAALVITSRNNLINAQYSFLQSLSKLRSLGAIDDEKVLNNMLMGN